MYTTIFSVKNFLNLSKQSSCTISVGHFRAQKWSIELPSDEIRKYCFKTSDCILIGDSPTDFKAAHENNIDFIYRGKKNLLGMFNSEYFIDDFMQVITHV